MVTAKDLAKRKNITAAASMLASMGPYDHALQRRWVGEDASLIQWTAKSDTSFDRESRDPD
jgi:hypothetical protein